MRTFLEIHKELLEIVKEMESERKVWAINSIALRLGSSARSVMSHCRVFELHGRVVIFPKESGKGFIVMPTTMLEKIKENKEEGEKEDER